MQFKNLSFMFVMLFICIFSVVGNVNKKPFHLPQYNQILEKTGFTISYSHEHKQPEWVAYKISKMNMEGTANRKNHRFKEDTAVIGGTASPSNLKGLKFHRGHMAPAAIMVWSDRAMMESHLLSNVSPQTPACNLGIWKRLENLTRKWVRKHDSVYVISGPILKKTLDKVGPDNVSVPKHFYKVVLRYCPDVKQAIGFIIPNGKAKGDLSTFAVTVDKVEEMTNIDFFESMDDTLENRIEGTFDYYTW